MAAKDGSIQVQDICRIRSRHAPTLLSQDTLEEIDLLAKEFGFHESHILKAQDIVTARWVGLKCRYGCANYNTSWCCPPAAPEFEGVRELLSEYELALLLMSENRNKHFYRNSAEKRRVQIRQWKSTVAFERKLFLMGYYKAFGLPAETCALCKECAYPKQCKFPNEKRPSLEACSIDVFETLKKIGRTATLAQRVEDSFLSCSIILLI